MTTLVPDLATGPPVERLVQKVVESVRVPHITLDAFCDTAEMSGIIENALADRRMSRAHATVHSGGMAAALTLYRQTASPNLVIFE
jgi:pilus assembly protein CpaE